tara:strand:- start:131 stop:265 length:135 start_codon:yes stop_codon:yes gene_type:complete
MENSSSKIPALNAMLILMQTKLLSQVASNTSNFQKLLDQKTLPY